MLHACIPTGISEMGNFHINFPIGHIGMAKDAEYSLR